MPNPALATMLCTTTEQSSWEDPVHLNGNQFAKLADGLAGMIAGVEEVVADGEHGADKPDAKRSAFCQAQCLTGWAATLLGAGVAAARGRGGAAADGRLVGEGSGRVSSLSLLAHHTFSN